MHEVTAVGMVEWKTGWMGMEMGLRLEELQRDLEGLRWRWVGVRWE